MFLDMVGFLKSVSHDYARAVSFVDATATDLVERRKATTHRRINQEFEHKTHVVFLAHI